MMSKKYLWIRNNNEMFLIDDPVKLFRGNQFDEVNDKLYELGSEVKMKVVLEPVSKYRGEFPNIEDNKLGSMGIKDGLGVGEYKCKKS